MNLKDGRKIRKRFLDSAFGFARNDKGGIVDVNTRSKDFQTIRPDDGLGVFVEEAGIGLEVDDAAGLEETVIALQEKRRGQAGVFAADEVAEIWLTFSDPQFRSENSRLTSPLFLERYRSFMKPGGIIHLKTDSMFLHQYSRAVAACNGLRVLGCTEDLYGTPREALSAPLSGELTPRPSLSAETLDALYGVQTFYEKMFLEQGYKITYLSFVIDHDGPYVHPDFDEDYWRSIEGPRLLFGHDSAETRRQKLHSD